MIAREKGSGQSLTGRFTPLSLTGRGRAAVNLDVDLHWFDAAPLVIVLALVWTTR